MLTLKRQQGIIRRQVIKVFPDALMVSVCNKQLTIARTCNPGQQLVHAFFVEFFKYIVQQQDGCEAFARPQDFIFSQLHGKEEAFALPL